MSKTRSDYGISAGIGYNPITQQPTGEASIGSGAGLAVILIVGGIAAYALWKLNGAMDAVGKPVGEVGDAIADAAKAASDAAAAASKAATDVAANTSKIIQDAENKIAQDAANLYNTAKQDVDKLVQVIPKATETGFDAFTTALGLLTGVGSANTAQTLFNYLAQQDTSLNKYAQNQTPNIVINVPANATPQQVVDVANQAAAQGAAALAANQAQANLAAAQAANLKGVTSADPAVAKIQATLPGYGTAASLGSSSNLNSYLTGAPATGLAQYLTTPSNTTSQPSSNNTVAQPSSSNSPSQSGTVSVAANAPIAALGGATLAAGASITRGGVTYRAG
ncbi:MAG: hypothetical protein WCX64_00375 [Candidatus Micrarchaeia archaeon]